MMDTRYFQALGYMLTPAYSIALFYEFIHLISYSNTKSIVIIPVLTLMIYCCFNLIFIDDIFEYEKRKIIKYSKEEKNE